MHRIDSPGNANNLFTEGNPSLGVPATEVSDDWLNDVQEELANLIENQGIVLQKGNQNQLEQAINNLLGFGGNQIKLDPLANDTLNQVVAGLVFDKANVKAASFEYDMHRQSDDGNEQKAGKVFVTHDPVDDVWRLSEVAQGLDDAGIVFGVTAAGQVRVSTDDFTGNNYSGVLRITSVVRFNQ